MAFRHFTTGMHAPLSAFNAIALEYPVFRIDPITEKDQKDCDAMPALRFSNRLVRRWWFVGCCAFGVAFGAPAFAADAENGKTIAETLVFQLPCRAAEPEPCN